VYIFVAIALSLLCSLSFNSLTLFVRHDVGI
jgi:hypothetical protein